MAAALVFQQEGDAVSAGSFGKTEIIRSVDLPLRALFYAGEQRRNGQISAADFSAEPDCGVGDLFKQGIQIPALAVPRKARDAQELYRETQAAALFQERPQIFQHSFRGADGGNSVGSVGVWIRICSFFSGSIVTRCPLVGFWAAISALGVISARYGTAGLHWFPIVFEIVPGTVHGEIQGNML